MRGVARAFAAISVVNALPLGIGAALAIDWPARTTAYVEPEPRSSARPSVEPRSSSTVIVRASGSAAFRRYARGPGRLRLVVRSTIPARRGLKSSSAVAGSVALATARACGQDPSREEVARLVAGVGRATGLSATGAFDDALAGLAGGGVVTDNRGDREVRRFEAGRGLAAVIWVPPGTHPLSPRVVRRFRRTPALARSAVDAALNGDWPSAMEANSRLVEAAMGYRYARVHEAVRQAGATASGVSGLGPAFAAVAPAGRIARVLRALPRERGMRRSVRLVPRLRDHGGERS